MAGAYLGFPVFKETELGVPEAVGAGVDVHVRIEGEVADAAESPLATDSNGEVAAGSIAAASAGDILYFRVENEDGLAGSGAQVLT